MTIDSVRRLKELGDISAQMWVDFNNKLTPIRTERKRLFDDIMDKFYSHKQRNLFLLRHGVAFDLDECTEDYMETSDDFRKDDFDIEFTTKGEDLFCTITVDFPATTEATKPIKVSELVDFLNNDDYYTPLMERLKRIEAFREEQERKKKEEDEYSEYLRLKAKYEN